MIFGKLKPALSRIPGLSVMDRYIATELIPPFLFGVGAFSSLLIAVDTLFELVRRVVESGLVVGVAVQVLLLKLPQLLSYAFPMSTLLAALMSYSRLSSDSEFIALRSCGVSIYRLVMPAVVLSVFVSGMTFFINEWVAPAANYQAKITLRNALGKETPDFRTENIFYPEYEKVKLPNGDKIKRLKRLFYAEQFDGQRMKGLTILDWSQQSLDQIVTSESALWNPTENTWDFFNGTIYLVSPDASYGNIVRFENQQLQLPRAPLDFAKDKRDYNERNIAQSLEYMRLLQAGGDDKKLVKLKVRIQQKISFPFVCLVFGLVGATLGTSPRRTGKATSFGISIVVIFGYYLLGFITGALGQVGVLSPFIAAWLPNFIGLGTGGFLLWRAAR